MKSAFLFGLLVVLFPSFAGASVIINELAWMGTLPKEGESTQAAANNEWIELYNNGSSGVPLTGWRITAQDGMPDIVLSGMIAAGGYFLLERSNDEVVANIIADLIYPYKNNALSNEGEHLFLKDAGGVVIDEVNASSGWPAGDNTTKETMQRVGIQWVTAIGTPRATNGVVVQPPHQEVGSPPSAPPPSGLSSPSSNTASLPAAGINAYAGEDKTVMVGSLIEFIGTASGIKNEPIDNARFWWNFGDGNTKEGRAVSHIFQIPGTYTMGLHVSSGTYAASDYLTLTVVPNQLVIPRVLGDEKGFIELRNPSKNSVEIGGWILADTSGKSFVIPPRTIMSADATIAFPNITTGLLPGPSGSVALFYPNLTKALEAHVQLETPIVPQEMKYATSSVISAARKEILESPNDSVQKQEKGDDVSPPMAQNDKTDPQIASVVSSSPSTSLFVIGALLFGVIASIGFLLIKRFYLS